MNFLLDIDMAEESFFLQFRQNAKTTCSRGDENFAIIITTLQIYFIWGSFRIKKHDNINQNIKRSNRITGIHAEFNQKIERPFSNRLHFRSFTNKEIIIQLLYKAQ